MSHYNSDYSSYYSTPDEEYYYNNNINGENVFYASTNSELLPCYASTFADTSSEIQRPNSLTREEIEAAKKGEQKLGLRLTKTPSLLNLFSKATSQTDDSLASADKLKAANFSALSLQIGSWMKLSRHEGDLIAKCYFKKRQLVWEVLNGNLKNKIEFLWSNIAAIKATFDTNGAGVLDIMLEKPPLFFHEVNPQPRKHTNWEQCGDFTEQQASLIRKHRLVFGPGVLDKHYNKIIQADSKLYSISQQPFPYHASMYFNEIHFSNQPICFDNLAVALPPHIPSNHPSVMNFSGHSMSNSPSNITTSGYNPGYHGLSSTNDEQPYYINDQSQFSIMSSANLGTTHQQAGYVHSSSGHATMENNIGQYSLGYENSMQQMTQLGNNSLPCMHDFLDSSYGYQNQYYHDTGGNQYYQNQN